ncbi:MAG TPA: hypothetical protein VK130_04990 [Steroidobacteraceae bacterium]|nr:hypothetical protein [Steroidobacteraceae bacterium]
MPGPLATRLTAADRPGVAQPVPERPVPDLPWGKMLLAAAALALLLGSGWEWYWRDYGVRPSYRDDNALWAIQRRQVDTTGQDATVFVGASRIFFDAQLPVWERLSGRRPIQLAIVGTSPLFALEDLADDRNFHGRVLVGVAPELFFSGYEFRKGWLTYLRKQSPSDRVGKWLSMHLVEPYFAFYDPDFALFPVIKRQAWPLRAGRQASTDVRKLSQTEADRNNRMWSKLEFDPQYRALARKIWEEDFHPPPPTPAEAADNQRTLDTQIARAVAAVAKLRARGVPVLFLREPSTGEYLAYEQRSFPRASTWDVLLAKTGAPGIYYQDYPQLQGYYLPEWSHMTGVEADRFTIALYALVDRQFGRPLGVRW